MLEPEAVAIADELRLAQLACAKLAGLVQETEKGRKGSRNPASQNSGCRSRHARGTSPGASALVTCMC